MSSFDFGIHVVLQQMVLFICFTVPHKGVDALVCVMVQYWQPKGSTTQTPTERGQSMPRKMQQIRGFPKSKDSCVVVTTIDIDIGQPYEV